MEYTVTRTRYERVVYPPHEHIGGVCTAHGDHYTREQVVRSIAEGNAWVTWDGWTSALIRPADRCPFPGCVGTPYLTTRPDDTTTNGLERLPRCESSAL